MPKSYIQASSEIKVIRAFL